MLKDIRVGLIARSDRTGLGNQTRNLARLLNPDKVLVIDSSPFNGNAQHPETYKGYNAFVSMGFLSDADVAAFCRNLDVVITCEIFYNNRFVDIANAMGVKTINHFNWEFADYLRDPSLTLPTKLVSPSYWHLDKANDLWGDRVEYLPTPVFTEDFAVVRSANMNRTGKKRFLHVMGRQAVHDRNGTLELLAAMRHSSADFELVIKAQSGDFGFFEHDPRITVDSASPEDETLLYDGFDAMILPRRYAGQCLPMTEALCAGLPVVMTDISPNNQVLDRFWLVDAKPAGRFMARTWVDMYSAEPEKLGVKLDTLAQIDLQPHKVQAYNIGYREYSNEVLKEKWEKLIESVAN